MAEPLGMLSAALAFAVVAASPGPANLAAASVAMAAGRTRGLRFALGLGLGLFFWGVLAAMGQGAVLRSTGWALTALKIAGAAYLLWLALQSLRAARRSGSTMVARAAPRRLFLAGLMLNLSNPKAVFAWMATLSLGLGGGSQNYVPLMLLCGLIGLVNYIGWVTFFSTGVMMRAYLRARRWIEAGTGFLLGAAGVSLLRSSASQ
ncbi:Threonine/homoserine/homoserine lactone efflux protein [Roseovarius azorensis]|uniref:Threonine/homoserine/homoserine lactone efflux protein n=1 Tax=Roseovarius azorensis TaxID=1287727 RepID=A0A1H7UEF3_9RHOB|nr:LysE family translocator [Roseovarius azorensis]SEL95085.1 Threonine/homoserine/homoserine lactone efflux protein [Roseovarius azorensis]